VERAFEGRSREVAGLALVREGDAARKRVLPQQPAQGGVVARDGQIELDGYTSAGTGAGRSRTSINSPRQASSPSG